MADVLPGWGDEWLVLERERFRQVRIHALEALAHRLCKQGRLIPALDAAYAAIAVETLRESAHATLVEIHLAEGDVVEARGQVDRYARLLWDEMQLMPSDGLLAKVPSGAYLVSRHRGREKQPTGAPPDIWSIRPNCASPPGAPPLSVPVAELDAARARVGSYRNLLLAPDPAGDVPVPRLQAALRSGIADCAARLGGTSTSFALPAWAKWRG